LLVAIQIDGSYAPIGRNEKTKLSAIIAQTNRKTKKANKKTTGVEIKVAACVMLMWLMLGAAPRYPHKKITKTNEADSKIKKMAPRKIENRNESVREIIFQL
jgi:hypothetical protein